MDLIVIEIQQSQRQIIGFVFICNILINFLVDSNTTDERDVRMQYVMYWPNVVG